MECIGKKYLIQGQLPKEEVKGGVILPVFGTNRDFGSYIGTIIGWGTAWTEEQKKDLIPIGSKVIMNYSKSVQKIRLIMGEKNYYIYNPDDILAIIEEQNGN